MKTDLETQFTRPASSKPWAYLPKGAYLAATSLAIGTAIIQLYLSATAGAMWLLFGGAVLLAAAIAGRSNARRLMLYALDIPYLVGQLFAWAMQGIPYAQLGVITVGLQGLLIAVLVYLLWVERSDREMVTLSSAVPQ